MAGRVSYCLASSFDRGCQIDEIAFKSEVKMGRQVFSKIVFKADILVGS